MKKRKKRTKKISLFPRTACAVLFTAAYITALVWVHWHICRIEGSSMEPSYGNGDLVYTETLPEGSAVSARDRTGTVRITRARIKDHSLLMISILLRFSFHEAQSLAGYCVTALCHRLP